MVSLEYLAGVFDGEGYVGVNVMQGGYMGVRLSVTNNNRGVLELFQQQFDGRIATPNAKGAGGASWTWQLYGPKAIVFLKSIQPFVVIKKPQVDLAVQFPIGAKGRGGVTREMCEKREFIHTELMKMKVDSRTPFDSKHPSGREILEENPLVRQAMNLYAAGLTTQEVADAIGATQAAVSYWTRELKVNRGRPAAGKLAGEHRKDAVLNRPEALKAREMYEQLVPMAEIARMLNAKPATVNYWLRKMGVTRPLSASQQLRRKREQVV
jgi:predicted transcriptional regulator